MAQILGDLVIIDLVFTGACILFTIAGIIEKTLEIKERKELKRAYRQKLNQEFKQVMNEIGESINDCYEEVVDGYNEST